MAVVTVKSQAVTNRDATPLVLNNGRIGGAQKQHMRGIVAIGNGDSATSKYLVGPLPSNALVTSVKISAPDIGTTTTADVGLYKSTKDGGAVVDADFFKAAVVLNAGAISKSEIVDGNVLSIANSEKAVWDALALTSDPALLYDVALTLVGAADAAGSVLVEVEYVL